MTASVHKSAPDQALLTPTQIPWQRERSRGRIQPMSEYVSLQKQMARSFSNAIVYGAAIAAGMLIAVMIYRVLAFIAGGLL